MNRRAIVIAVVVAAVATFRGWPRVGKRATGPMPNDVYVWQRAWTEAVQEATTEHATNFTELVALAAELSWQHKQPRLVRVALDYPILRGTGRPVGLALRIGSFPGPFDADDERTRALADLAASLLREADTHDLRVCELQIDFDCAESKLDGYRVWVEAIRRRVTPVPVTITALPAWLKRSAFKRLIGTADGYVLQVHSLARPIDASAAFSLCDSEEARRAVERAARLRKPFRVALPTYGYLVAFDAKGRFVGLSAEGPGKSWPDGTKVIEVRSDSKVLADLVASWNRDRPKALTGVIWYRLPVEGDSLNWSWPTLARVMAGDVPRSNLRTETRCPQPELLEVDLVNSGQADFSSPVSVRLSWREARLVAADGLDGFALAEGRSNALQFRSQPRVARIEAGRRRMIGWLRLDRKAEVQVELDANHN